MDSKEYKCKIVLLGESSTGKTSIINNIFKREFQEEMISTLGGGYETADVKIGDKIIKAAFWDTTGQEKFRAIAKSFYRSTDIAILVYDITKKKTFEAIQTYWYQELIDNSKGLKGKNIIYF